MKRTLATHFTGRATTEIHVFPTWANTRIAPVAPTSVNPIRERLKINQHFVVTYAGNLSASQDLGLILQVADKLRHHQNISFVLIGAGEALNTLKDMSAGLQLSNVHFLPRQPESELANVLSTGDCTFVVIGPAFAGISMPSKFASSLAMGTPVLAVTPKETLMAEIINKYSCGQIIQPGDYEQAAATIVHLYENPEARASMSANAKEAARQNFSSDTVPAALAKSIVTAARLHFEVPLDHHA